jgi:hypothetical protein
MLQRVERGDFDVLRIVLLAFLTSAMSSSSIGGPAAPAKLIRVTSGSCVAMTADVPQGYRLINSCSECRTALVAWCDGDAHLFDVPANGWTHVAACRGPQMLLSDVRCDHSH